MPLLAVIWFAAFTSTMSPPLPVVRAASVLAPTVPFGSLIVPAALSDTVPPFRLPAAPPATPIRSAPPPQGSASRCWPGRRRHPPADTAPATVSALPSRSVRCRRGEVASGAKLWPRRPG